MCVSRKNNVKLLIICGMKKILITFLLCVCSTNFVSSRIVPTSWQEVSFKVWKPATNGNPVPKSPEEVPEVYLDGHALHLYDIENDFTLVLIDENDDEAYTTLVTSGTSTITLPSTLSGDYEIRLFANDGSYFYDYVLF